jgi:hypothetical protein
MSGLVSVEALPYRALAAWWALVRSGLLWALCCLPLITAPAATVLLCEDVDRLRRGEPPRRLGDRRRALRAAALPALQLGLALALLPAGLALLVWAAPGPARAAAAVVAVCVGVTWALCAPWSVALLASRRAGWRDALRCAYLRALRRPDLAALATFAVAVAVLSPLLFPAGVRAVVLLSAPGLGALAAVSLCDLASPRRKASP